jgi:hypothetical protein
MHLLGHVLGHGVLVHEEVIPVRLVIEIGLEDLLLLLLVLRFEACVVVVVGSLVLWIALIFTERVFNCRWLFLRRFDMQFAALEVAFIELGIGRNGSLTSLEANKPNAKRNTSSSLPEGDLYVNDLAILAKLILQLLLRHLIRQVLQKQALCVDELRF